MQKKSRAYDQFSKKERIGILAFIVIVLLLISIPYLIPKKPLPDLSAMTADGKKWNELLDRTIANESNNPLAIRLYPFDPNTLSMEEWQRFGVPITVAKRIIHYVSKGGQFRKAEDLRKIWGMPPLLADRLIPYVRTNYQEPVFKKTIRTIQSIDINTADLEAWKSLPGIGDVLAARIIKYRERSNGFSSKEELKSVFGLKDSLLMQIDPYLQINESNLQKLPLNRTSAYQIVQKTGVSIEIAKAIVLRRQINGLFTEIDQLLEIPGFKSEWLSRFKSLFFIE
jgi:competence protein ComEA